MQILHGEEICPSTRVEKLAMIDTTAGYACKEVIKHEKHASNVVKMLKSKQITPDYTPSAVDSIEESNADSNISQPFNPRRFGFFFLLSAAAAAAAFFFFASLPSIYLINSSISRISGCVDVPFPLVASTAPIPLAAVW